MLFVHFIIASSASKAVGASPSRPRMGWLLNRHLSLVGLSSPLFALCPLLLFSGAWAYLRRGSRPPQQFYCGGWIGRQAFPTARRDATC